MNRRKAKPRKAILPDKATLKDRLLRKLELDRRRAQLRIAKLEKAAALLELSRSRYVTLFDFAPIGYVKLDDKAIIQELNRTVLRMAGISRRQMLGMPFTIVVAKEDRPKFFQHLHHCRNSGGRTVETELTFCSRDKKEIPVQLLSVLFGE